MPAPLYSSADYLAALQALLPHGSVWPRGSDAVQTKVLSGLSKIYARTNSRANQVIPEALPTTTFELLPEWEATLGLPDPCVGVSPTVQTRRTQVITRFGAIGGQSISYLVQFAANLGFPTFITQFAPSRAGQLRAGLPVNGNAWAYAWRVTAPLNTSSPFLAGRSYAGEPISSSGNAVLECEIRAIAPAHTMVFFNYSDEAFALITEGKINGAYGTESAVNLLHTLIHTTLPSIKYW